MPDNELPSLDHLEIVELEERLEFGAVILDSDLGADNNTGCTNQSSCQDGFNTSCSNVSNCG